MEGLYPAVEHLREARDGGDVGHGQARIAEGRGGAPGRHELEAGTCEALGEVHQVGLVRNRQQGAPTSREALGGGRQIDGRAIAGDPNCTGKDERHRPWQEPVLDGLDALVKGLLGVVRQDGDRFLEQDGPPIDDLVDEMDRSAGDRDPGRERIAHGVRARECRQERGVRVEDVPVEGGECRRADQPHVAGQRQYVDRRLAQGVAHRAIVAAGDEGRLEPALSGPRECRALAISDHEGDVAAELTALGRGGEREEIAAGPADGDGDPAVHSIGAST